MAKSSGPGSDGEHQVGIGTFCTQGHSRLTLSIGSRLRGRIDVGGKLLTNQLKRLLSFRQWDLMAETHIVNRIREECCYVTSDWKRDLERAR